MSIVTTEACPADAVYPLQPLPDPEDAVFKLEVSDAPPWPNNQKGQVQWIKDQYGPFRLALRKLLKQEGLNVFLEGKTVNLSTPYELWIPIKEATQEERSRLYNLLDGRTIDGVTITFDHEHGSEDEL